MSLLYGQHIVSHVHVLLLCIESERKWKRDFWHWTNLVSKSCHQHHPYAWSADRDPLGQFFCARSLFLKAKGYSTEQIICLCRWLWESPARPLGLYAVCLCDPPHRLTIYAVNDSSPWSHARAQWRQASRATAALLARHQNPGKISLGLRPGASRSVPQPLQENTFRTATFRAAVLTKWGANHMKGHIETSNNQMGETGRVTGTTENVRMCFSIYFLWAFQDRRRVRIADTYIKVLSNICICVDR